MKEKLRGKFKYVVIFVILFIPFVYSFFYLKAYWDPYGKGNIDNLPVAVVNEDTGDKGQSLIDGIKDSKKLKLFVISNDKAEDGLYDGKYYAIIKIPSDFTDSMESVSSDNKKHATITYSPNQKSNYLSSQIINTVVLNVEKNIDNEINSNIVKGLSNNLKEVPNKLDEINNGFNKLNDGTNKLKDGSTKILDGSTSLSKNYSKFNNALSTVDLGTKKLYDGSKELDAGLLKLQLALSNMDLSGLNDLQNSVGYLNDKEYEFNAGLQSYNMLVTVAINNPEYLNYPMSTLHSVDERIPNLEITLKDYILESSNTLNSSSSQILGGVNMLNTELNGDESKINDLKSKLVELKQGVDSLKAGSSNIVNGLGKLNEGSKELTNGSNQIFNGINDLKNANSTLNTGITTLNNSVIDARKELLSKTGDTRNELEKVETLEEYSKEPIKVETKEVNKVKSYGTAFSPLFICVGLWVGCLMMFMVLYYDKDQRYGIFGMEDKRYVKKTLAYHALITISAFVLAICLNIFLDLNITNYALYYLSFILIGNAFMSLIEFLITNFEDIGKFIALILLVLQLAASGGTFPIQVVTKGFRWMNQYLPMTYAINLLKESLIKVENNLIGKPVIVLLVIFVVFFTINILRDIKKQKKTD